MSRFLNIVRSHGGLIILGLFYLYLTVHAVSGSQGIFKLAQYDTKIESLQAKIVDVQAERLALERIAGQLRSSSLNADMLDQESRRILSVSHVNDIVIFLDE